VATACGQSVESDPTQIFDVQVRWLEPLVDFVKK